MLLPNPHIVLLIDCKEMCFKFVLNKKQDRISRKTVIKSIEKGGMALLDIQQFLNE